MILRPRQSQLVERALGALHQHGNTLALAPTGCHAPGTPILMADGRVMPVEDIRVGDHLMGPDSTPRCVLEVHRGRDTMFEIRPLKGDPFVVNHGHILTLVRTNEGRDGRQAARNGEIVDVPLAHLLRASPTFRHVHKLFRVPVQFSAHEPPCVDPYFLGVLLGDGSLQYVTAVTTPDVAIVETVYAQAAHYGLRVRVEQLHDNAANTYHLVGQRGEANPLTHALRRLGVHGCGSADKFVPAHYRCGTPATRLAVLAGLLDTDGHLVRGTTFEFVSRSPQLAGDVVFVARSLGFLATRRAKDVNGTRYWRVHVSGDTDRIPTRVLHKQATPRRQKKNPLRTGFTVHEVGVGDYIGFSVDQDHRYVMGDFTVTHNSGKTIMLSAVTGQLLAEPDARACILAHRDELTAQNRAKFLRVNPRVSTSIVDATEKSWEGRATFAMVQTLAREAQLAAIPSLDLLVIDEAHHATAPAYRRVIDRVRERNPDAKVFGVTATAARGDRQGLRAVFSNVADQITLGELIASGHLVPPRTHVIDVGAQSELQEVPRTTTEFDMDAVAAILNTRPITDAVIRHWREKAGDRPTIVFCATVAHALDVHAAFVADGIRAVVVHGDLSDTERRRRLAAYESGEAQVVVNVAVLTEGYDHTPTACIVLLRLSSHKSTLTQMIGRGLRTVDPAEHPGVVKIDCIVLDFGTATLEHGSLEQDASLDGHDSAREAPTKDCPSCKGVVPLGTRTCPLCSFVWTREVTVSDMAPLADFVMTEIDLLARSNFQWIDLYGADDAWMAVGFDAWAGVFGDAHHWIAIGGSGRATPRLLAVGERLVGFAAANDWLNTHETLAGAHKSRRWLAEPPTAKQLRYLTVAQRNDYSLTRYRASVLITFTFHQLAIRQLAAGVLPRSQEAA